MDMLNRMVKNQQEIPEMGEEGKPCPVEFQSRDEKQSSGRRLMTSEQLQLQGSRQMLVSTCFILGLYCIYLGLCIVVLLNTCMCNPISLFKSVMPNL